MKLIKIVLVALVVMGCGGKSDKKENGGEKNELPLLEKSTVRPEKMEKLIGFYNIPMDFDDETLNNLPIRQQPLRAFLHIERNKISVVMHCGTTMARATSPAYYTDDKYSVINNAAAEDEECRASLEKGTSSYAISDAGLLLSNQSGESITLDRTDSSDVKRLGLQ